MSHSLTHWFQCSITNSAWLEYIFNVIFVSASSLHRVEHISHCCLWNGMPPMLHSHRQTIQCCWKIGHVFLLSPKRAHKFSIGQILEDVSDQSITSIPVFCKSAVHTQAVCGLALSYWKHTLSCLWLISPILHFHHKTFEVEHWGSNRQNVKCNLWLPMFDRSLLWTAWALDYETMATNTLIITMKCLKLSLKPNI